MAKNIETIQIGEPAKAGMFVWLVRNIDVHDCAPAVFASEKGAEKWVRTAFGGTLPTPKQVNGNNRLTCLEYEQGGVILEIRQTMVIDYPPE